MSRIDTAKTVEKKKEFLKSKILDRLDKEENYVDIVVLFTKSEMEEKLLENVPPVRLKFDM
jgi:predicted CoA-binding protein